MNGLVRRMLVWLAAFAVLAVIAAAVGAASAGSQEIGGVRFAWEINLTTVTIVVGGAFTWWLTVVRQGDKVATHASTITKLEVELAKKVESNALKKVQDDIEELGLKYAKVEHEHTALKEEVYKDYLNADAVREIKNEIRQDVAGTEGRLMEAINALSGRLDNFSQEKHHR